MVKIIPGKRGSGKTKLLIEAIRNAKKESNGNVVAIQVGNSLDSEIRHDVRLINIEDYSVNSYDGLGGFIEGMMASDYDCTHIFIDGILKIVGRDLGEVYKMLEKVNKSSNNETDIILTVSADLGDFPEGMKKYL